MNVMSNLPLYGLRLVVTLPPAQHFWGCALAIAKDSIDAICELGGVVHEFDTAPFFLGDQTHTHGSRLRILRHFRARCCPQPTKRWIRAPHQAARLGAIGRRPRKFVFRLARLADYSKLGSRASSVPEVSGRAMAGEPSRVSWRSDRLVARINEPPANISFHFRHRPYLGNASLRHLSI